MEYIEYARVFPRRTVATPTDPAAFIGMPPKHVNDLIFNRIDVSVTYTYDMKYAAQLADAWSAFGDVRIGGPAFNMKPGDFVPGKYVKPGYVITSRGCPNRCWFCNVWRKEGGIRELPITNGYNVLDSNLLACSRNHIIGVFDMLKRQPQRPVFTGGLEAKRLEPWHCYYLNMIKTERIYFAYDTPDDWEPLVDAISMINKYTKLNSHQIMCFVLSGYPKDTKEKAEKRLFDVIKAGAMPYAMVYRDKKGERSKEWMEFLRPWRQTIYVGSIMRDMEVIRR